MCNYLISRTNALIPFGIADTCILLSYISLYVYITRIDTAHVIASYVGYTTGTLDTRFEKVNV